MKHINKLSVDERRALTTKLQNYIVDIETELDSRRDCIFKVTEALRALCAELGDTKVSLKLAEQIFKALND